MTLARITLICLGIFLLLFGIDHATNIQIVWMQPIEAIAALVAGALCLLQALRGGTLVLLFIAVMSSQCCSQTPLDFEVSKTQFAYAMALGEQTTLPTPSPSPSPNPEPLPGSKCVKCNGTGVVYPDGRIAQECQVCGGDGIVGMPAQALARAQDNILQRPQRRELPDVDKDAEWEQLTPLNNETSSTRWIGNLVDAKAEQKTTAQPMLIFFRGEAGTCPPCEKLERLLARPKVAATLTNLVLCKLIAENYPEECKSWGIFSVPALYIVSADFKQRREITLSSDENVLAANLEKAVADYKAKILAKFSEQETPENQVSQVVYYYQGPVARAVSAVTGCPCGMPGCVCMVSQPAAVTYVQPATYQYAQPTTYYTGGSAGAMGSAGGSASYYVQPRASYYSQPSYQQPSYYSQPSYNYSSGFYGGGGGDYYGGGGCASGNCSSGW